MVVERVFLFKVQDSEFNPLSHLGIRDREEKPIGMPRTVRIRRHFEVINSF
jgi:hypothetical protein